MSKSTKDKTTGMKVGGGGCSGHSSDPVECPSGQDSTPMIAPEHPGQELWDKPSYAENLGETIDGLKQEHPDAFDEVWSFIQDDACTDRPMLEELKEEDDDYDDFYEKLREARRERLEKEKKARASGNIDDPEKS